MFWVAWKQRVATALGELNLLERKTPKWRNSKNYIRDNILIKSNCNRRLQKKVEAQ